MIYRERKPRYISAFKVPGEIPPFIKCIDPETLSKEFGLDSFPDCNVCGRSIKEHIIINNGNTLICPGSYVIYEGTIIVNIMSSDNFEQLYEALGDTEYENS